MTTRRVKLFTLAALAAAIAIAPAPRTSQAQEKPPREQVQDLLPRLQSEDDALRTRAEDRLFALGEPGRLEMERLSRSKDSREAETALRLLQSDRWSKKTLRDGEQALRRIDDDEVREFRTEIERGFADARRLMEEALRRMPEIRVPQFEIGRRRDELRRIDLPEIEWPEIHWKDIEFPKIDWSDIELPRVALRSAPSGSVAISGAVTRDGSTLQWSRAVDGRTSVTVKDGDAEPRTFEADSVAAFRELYPHIAERLDAAMPSWTGGPTLRILGGLPELDVNQDPRAATPRLPAPTPVLGIGFEAPSELLLHHLGLESGVVVTRVLRDSRAAALGLQRLDILLALSGHPVSSEASIRRALREIGDDTLTADIVRAGERLVLRAK